MTTIETNGYLSRCHATSIIVTSKLDVYLCQWYDCAHDDDEAEGWLMRALPLPPHPASHGDFLTAKHYARLYHLMKSVKAAHQAGRVNLDSYTLYAEYFNAITEIAEATHGADLLDEAVTTYTPPTTGKPTDGTAESARRKTSQMPNLLDEQPDTVNEPSAIYPDVITAIYNRQLNPATNQRYGYCVLSGTDFAIIPVIDWLNNTDNVYNGPLLPYSDPFDTVEEH